MIIAWLRKHYFIFIQLMCVNASLVNLKYASSFVGVRLDFPISQRSGNMAADVGAPPAWHPCLFCAHQACQKHCDRWTKSPALTIKCIPLRIHLSVFFSYWRYIICSACLQQLRGTPQWTTSAAPVDLATRVPWWVSFFFSIELIRMCFRDPMLIERVQARVWGFFPSPLSVLPPGAGC